MSAPHGRRKANFGRQRGGGPAFPEAENTSPEAGVYDRGAQ